MISNEIRETLQKVCSVLNQHNVDYLVVGGVAVGFHGYQRFSTISNYRPELKTDLDFWYNPSTENFINVLNALDSLEVDTTSIKAIVFDPKKAFLKIPHQNFHTDFLPQMEGLSSYLECKRNAEKHVLDGNEIHIIGYDDLLKNKMSINREIDKTDVAALEKIKKNKSQ